MNRITCLLSDLVQRQGEHIAVIDENNAISYAQLEYMVEGAIDRLGTIGVQKGERVSILAPNSLEYIVALIAFWRMGVVACLLSTRLPELSIAVNIEKINSKKILLFRDVSIGEPSAIQRIYFEEIIPQTENIINNAKHIEIRLDQDATILFTSGSTSDPKAVLHSYGNHYFNALGSNQNILLEPNDRWILALPLYHAGGLAILFRVLLAGSTIVIPQTNYDLTGCILKNNATHISLVYTQLYRMLKSLTGVKALTILKAILLGGSAVPSWLMNEAQRRSLPLYCSYGLTEMASQVVTTDRYAAAKTLPYRMVMISNEKEILVKGETLFKGYIRDNEIQLPLDEDGWFHTGDLGRMNDDSSLIILGRKDNMFVSGGENLYPEEIEACLLQLDHITQAMVVPMDHLEFGHRPVAFIKTEVGVPINKTVLIKHLENLLPRFKLPINFLDWPEEISDLNQKGQRRYFKELVKDKNVKLSSI